MKCNLRFVSEIWRNLRHIWCSHLLVSSRRFGIVDIGFAAAKMFQGVWSSTSY